MATHSPEFYREQLNTRISLLERLIRIKAPRRSIERQEELIRETRIASGEYKAISGADESGGELICV